MPLFAQSIIASVINFKDMEVTFNTLPTAMEVLIDKVDKIEKALRAQNNAPDPLPPTIPLKKAAELAGKTANALRVQISLGNLKCHHVGGRIYLDTDYFQRWLRGEVEPEIDPRNILKK